MSAPTAGLSQDEPLYLTCDGVDLFGIYTPPVGQPTDVGVHLLAGGGVHSTAGRSRSRVHLARHLADRGFGVLRTDHPGTGESGGEFAPVDFEAPAIAEVREAVAYLGSRHQKVAVVANCFGSRNVIHAADQLDRLDAVVLIAPPLEDRDHSQATLHHRSLGEWARRGIDPRRWPRFLGHARNGYARIVARRARLEVLRAVGRAPAAPPDRREVIPTLGRWLERGVPILLISSEQEDFHPDLLIALEGALGELKAQHADLFDVVFAASQLSTGSSQAAQQEARTTVTEWLERRLA